MPKTLLTARSVSDAICPQGQSKINLFDTQIKGLMLEVRESGGKTYYFSYQSVRGKRRYVRLGDALEMTLDEAQEKAVQHRRAVREGQDPAEARAELRRVPTFAEFVDQDFLPEIRNCKRSWKSDVSLLNNHLLPALGQRYLDTITPRDIQRLINSRREMGKAPGTCDRILILARHIFNRAIKWGIAGVKSNPAKEVDLLRVDNKRERFLNADEVGRMYDALLISDNRMLQYIVPMLLVTGARKGEVLYARWQDFDFDKRLWRIPHTKNGRPRTVPMSDGVMAILQTVPRSHSPYVFVNSDTGKPYVSIHYAWDTARKRAGLKDVRLHDLRHSFASILINSGRSLYEVQHLLGHTQVKTTERYAHLQQDTLLRAANVVNDVVGRILPSTPAAPRLVA